MGRRLCRGSGGGEATRAGGWQQLHMDRVVLSRAVLKSGSMCDSRNPSCPALPTHHLGFSTLSISDSLLVPRELNSSSSTAHCFSPRNKPTAGSWLYPNICSPPTLSVPAQGVKNTATNCTTATWNYFTYLHDLGTVVKST